MGKDDEFMDVDGPEFLLNVNNQIENIRSVASESLDVFEYSKASQSSSQTEFQAYSEIAVLDTNFLISKLGYLDTVLDLASETPGSLLIILPWVVIRELDGLKSSFTSSNSLLDRSTPVMQHEQDVSVRARKAMRFIEMRLRDKCVALRGQKMNEIYDPMMLKHAKKGDDRILDCCMYFLSLTGKKVTLLSNDRNLCIKVMVHDIDSISAESTPKLEDLLKQIVLNGRSGGGGKITNNQSLNYSHPQVTGMVPPLTIGDRRIQPAHTTGDYTMEVDEFHAHNNGNDPTVHTNNTNIHLTTAHDTINEDFDMMIDEDEEYEIVPADQPITTTTKQTKERESNLSRSMWAPHNLAKDNNRYKKNRYYDDEPAYLDEDLTITATNRNEDNEWTSIYSQNKK